MKINLNARINQSAVIEDKKKEDSSVTTQFTAIIGPGVFSNYSKDLEHIIFQTNCWESIKCGEQSGVWTMKVVDPSDKELACIEECTIKDLTIKLGKEDVLLAVFKVIHKYSNFQKALDCAVSTTAFVYLEREAATPQIED
jgi:hypothetical protein